MYHFSPDRIFLIGYMASGKSTLAKVLAKKLNFDHIDTDNAIEQLNDETIENIFESKGEEWFRKEEERVLSFVTELDKVVISTGGGMPIFSNNLEKMLHSGLTIYLELPPAILSGRIRSDNTSRPLHNIKDDISLEQEVSKRLEARQQYYREAHLIVNGNQSKDQLTENIASLIIGNPQRITSGLPKDLQ